VILLWPFPPAFLGIAWSALSQRFRRGGAAALVILVTFLAGENLLNTNQYLARLIVNGAGGGWTDAIEPLAGALDRKTASWFGLVDWGYLNALRMFRGGDFPFFLVDSNDPKEFERQLSSPEFLFIQHTDDKQMFPGINDRVRKAAAAAGYTEKLERTIPDRNGRPVYELFRFEKAAIRPSRTPAAE